MSSCWYLRVDADDADWNHCSSQRDNVTHDVFDMLASLADFNVFCNMIIAHKKVGLGFACECECECECEV